MGLVWGRAKIELATSGSAVRHVSAVRRVTDFATRSGYTTPDNILSGKLGHQVNSVTRLQTVEIQMTHQGFHCLLS